MKEQMAILLNLQKIDAETGRIQSILDSVSQKLEALDSRLDAFEKNLEDKKSTLEALEATYRSYESDAKMTLERINKSEKNLRVVKTNREYQTVLREIDDNKKKISEMEDEMLRLMDQIETEEKDLSKREIELSQLKKQVESEREDILDSSAEERESLAEIGNEREKIAERIDPRLLETYNKILKQCRGLAIVPVENSICGGCHMNIPPQEYIEIQRGGSLKFCPHCHRIMYWKQVAETE